MVKILVEADRFLPAVLVNLLLKVAVPIKQPDRDEIQVEIARRFTVIARKDAKTARVIGNRFVKAKFRREISDRLLDLTRGAFFPVGVLAREILLVSPMDLPEIAQEDFVPRHFEQPPLARELEHPDRVVVGAIPKLGIEMSEKPAGRRLPCPPEIEDHFAQRLELRRKVRDNVIGLNIGHDDESAACETEAKVWQQNAEQQAFRCP